MPRRPADSLVPPRTYRSSPSPLKGDEERFRAAVMNGCVTKPVDTRVIRAVVFASGAPEGLPQRMFLRWPGPDLL